MSRHFPTLLSLLERAESYFIVSKINIFLIEENRKTRKFFLNSVEFKNPKNVT